jgi:hypothetical protein
MSTVMPVTDAMQNETVDPWKLYVRQNEDFSCESKIFDKFI